MSRSLINIVEKWEKAANDIIEFYNIRYTKDEDLEHKMFQALKFGNMGMFKSNSTVQFVARKSNFKVRKSVMILFGDKSAATRVIFE